MNGVREGEEGVIERAACSWMTEDVRTERARREFTESAVFHDAHGDDLSKCDSWLCVCGRTDSRGGSWEQLEVPTPFGAVPNPSFAALSVAGSMTTKALLSAGRTAR
jgi:hypothetical protein